MSTDKKQVIFIEDRVSGLRAGEYSITVDEHIVVTGQDVDEHFAITRSFQVKGERFTLLDSEIHSVFPPNKSTGPYRGCVPHITFNRAMLPWLRGLGQDENPSDGWLAVLLFDTEEMPPVQTKTVQDLISGTVTAYTQPDTGSGTGKLPSGYVSYPFPTQNGQLTLEYNEKLSDLISVIDVLGPLFHEVAPAEADMTYLAHIRQVDLAGRSAKAGRGAVQPRAKEGEEEDVGQFSTVMGSRLPAIGNAHVVLVSLEGLGPYLLGGAQAGEIGSNTMVRLVVLKEWQFSTLPEDDVVLKHALEHLCDDPTDPDGLISHLRIPAPIPLATDVADALNAEAQGQLTDDQADILVRHGFALGYTPHPHYMRTGDYDISWYRGPLTPVAVVPNPPVPYDSSDAALAYNPETGLFDVSYAAAWQLGQLMALNNRQFAAALYNWQLALLERGASENDQLSQLLPILATKAKDGGNGIAAIFTRLFAAEFTGPRSRRFAKLADTDVPPIVTQYLTGLKTQLTAVPLNYVLPDSRLMPGEALRFFHLDTNWINALIDGSCSIVRSLTGQAISQTAWVYQPGDGPITGYLLNSAVVIGWPGLKIVAYNGTTVLDNIFDDELAPGMRMALFQGDIDRLEVQEAGEGLHFGVDDNDNGTYSVELRELLPGQVGQLLNNGGNFDRLPRVIHYDHTAAGWTARGEPQPQPEPVVVSATMRGAKGRTIDVATTANAIHQGLIANQAIEAGGPFTSAEYALEMVKGIVHVSYCLNKSA